MNQQDWPEETKRFIEAVKKEQTAREKVRECLNERSPGHALVVRNGRAEISAAFSQREANAARISRHVCCNLLIDVIDENNASGVVYLTLYRNDGEVGRRSAPSDVPDIVGEYRDTFVRTKDGWRFKRRDIAASFVKRREQAKA